jgi:hypothetical protein
VLGQVSFHPVEQVGRSYAGRGGRLDGAGFHATQLTTNDCGELLNFANRID